jgi:hypothetical protein
MMQQQTTSRSLAQGSACARRPFLPARVSLRRLQRVFCSAVSSNGRQAALGLLPGWHPVCVRGDKPNEQQLSCCRGCVGGVTADRYRLKHQLLLQAQRQQSPQLLEQCRAPESASLLPAVTSTSTLQQQRQRQQQQLQQSVRAAAAASSSGSSSSSGSNPWLAGAAAAAAVAVAAGALVAGPAHAEPLGQLSQVMSAVKIPGRECFGLLSLLRTEWGCIEQHTAARSRLCSVSCTALLADTSANV